MATKIDNCPIVESEANLSYYSLDRFGPKLLAIVDAGLETAPTYVSDCRLRVLRLFQCFLEISGDPLSEDNFDPVTLVSSLCLFAGALNSPRFVEANLTTRRWYTKFVAAAIEGARIAGADVPSMFQVLSFKRQTEEVRIAVEKFEQIPLDESQVWKWRGWKITNFKRKDRWLPLATMYERMGREFTEVFHRICREAFSSMRGDSLPLVSELAMFIGNSTEVTPALLLEPIYAEEFWHQFVESCLASKTRPYETTVSWLRNFFFRFYRNHLTRSGIFATFHNDFPIPPLREFNPGPSLADVDESVDQGKLLVPIPVTSSRKELFDYLYVKLPEAISQVEKWAKAAANDLYVRSLQTRQISRFGNPRHLNTQKSFIHEYSVAEYENENLPANTAATLCHYGYITRRDIPNLRLMFPGISECAYRFGLPTRHALLPHAIQLVISHPEITPSFLTELELWDKNGNLIGFTKTDAGYRLRGFKYRKGARNALQEIALTEQTTNVIRQILVITAPLRKYLRNIGDNLWRRLFLQCGRAFSHPRPTTLFSLDSAQHRVRVANELCKFSGTSKADAESLVGRIQLRIVRDSVAVNQFANSGSLAEAADMLDHATVDQNLIDRYIPPEIQVFVRQHVIRTFQVAMVAEQMRESEYALRATGFSSAEELNRFMMENALTDLPNPVEGSLGADRMATPCNSPDANVVVFPINTTMLSVWMSIGKAAESNPTELNGTGRFYAPLATGLLRYLESIRGQREEFDACFDLAKSMADISLIKDAIYE